jgi:DNA-binding LacI/PurR family transcriptional regulator
MKSVTIRDVAKQCGISTAVASAALRSARSSVRYSPATQARVHAAARLLNYQPNRLAQAVKTGVVPVVAVALHADQADTDRINTYLHDTLPTAGIRLHERGLEMLFLPFSSCTEAIARLERLIAEGLIGGVISNVLRGEERVLSDFLKASGVPFVLLAATVTDLDVPCVQVDQQVTFEQLHAYARQRGFADAVALAVPQGSTGGPVMQRFDPARHAVVETQDATLLSRPDVLLAAPGLDALAWLERHGTPADRIILVEDPRLWRGRRPVLLVKSTVGRRAALAVDLITPWVQSGVRPAGGAHVVAVRAEDLELLT